MPFWAYFNYFLALCIFHIINVSIDFIYAKIHKQSVMISRQLFYIYFTNVLHNIGFEISSISICYRYI